MNRIHLHRNVSVSMRQLSGFILVGFHMIATNVERSMVVVAKIANIRQEEAVREAEAVACQQKRQKRICKLEAGERIAERPRK